MKIAGKATEKPPWQIRDMFATAEYAATPFCGADMPLIPSSGASPLDMTC